MGVGGIFDRVLTELVAKMREMNMDKTELGCLRSIILFNPGMYICFVHNNRIIIFRLLVVEADLTLLILNFRKLYICS